MPLRVGSALLLGALCGCGVAGIGDPLPEERFPYRGLGPYQLLDTDALEDAPLLLRTPGRELDEPSAMPLSPRSLLLWMTVRAPPRAAVGFTRVEEDQGRLVAAETEEVIADARRPTVLLAPQGAPLPPTLLLYQQASGALRLAIAEGPRLQELPGTLADLGPGPVSAVLRPGWLSLYAVQGEGMVRRADAGWDALQAFIQDHAPIPWRTSEPLLLASDCPVLQGGTLVPAQALRSLAARRVDLPTGRTRYELYLRAESGADASLCGAASFDGERFLVAPDPLLPRGGGGTPTSATQAPLGAEGRWLLWLGWRSAQQAIAVARSGL